MYNLGNSISPYIKPRLYITPFSILLIPGNGSQTNTHLRGPGEGGHWSKVDFHFFDVSYRGEWQLPGTFSRMKKYCS